MSTDSQHYKFTPEQVSLMQKALGRMIDFTGVQLQCSFATVLEAEGFVLRVSDGGLAVDRDLLAIQSIVDRLHPVSFAVLDFAGRQIGPSRAYTSFVEALGHAESFACGVIEEAKSQRAEQATAERRGASDELAALRRPARPSARPRTNGLSQHDTELIEAFAMGIGRAAQSKGFSNIVAFEANAISVGLGFEPRAGVPVVLGTLVVVSHEDGGCECSVRGVKGMEIPGLDNYYPSVTSALSASLGYFHSMATEVGKSIRPSVVGRLLRTVGL